MQQDNPTIPSRVCSRDVASHRRWIFVGTRSTRQPKSRGKHPLQRQPAPTNAGSFVTGNVTAGPER